MAKTYTDAFSVFQAADDDSELETKSFDKALALCEKPDEVEWLCKMVRNMAVDPADYQHLYDKGSARIAQLQA